METTRRKAGAGLVGYAVGTAGAFMAIGAPGGSYDDRTVADYMSSGHWAVGMALSYVGAFAALGLLLFAHRMRREVGAAGDVLWGLMLAATAAGVIGWFLVGGISVSFAEGGSGVAAVPHTVVYLISEMSNLIAVCASSFFIGAAAIVVAAKGDLPRRRRVVAYGAGVCGVLAAFFFPLFLLWLWAIVFGLRLMAQKETAEPSPTTRPA